MDSDLLLSFMAKFVGYGNPDARFWMVGVEEGTQGLTDHHQVEELLGKYLEIWCDSGKPHLLDLPEFHQRMNYATSRFGERAEIQRSWAGAIRILLSYSLEQPVTDEMVKQFQVERLGRSDSDTALMELNPLPAAGTGEWPYGNLSACGGLEFLSSRSAYERICRKRRLPVMESLLRAAGKGGPELVVMYSSRNYNRQCLEAITGVALSKCQTDEGVDFWKGQVRNTIVAAVQHPTARRRAGISYYNDVGLQLAGCR